MEELRDRVTSPIGEVSADLAAWLAPPRRPVLATSHRHWTGFRNSLAFGIVCMIVFAVVCFAVTGSGPGPSYSLVAIICAVVIGFRNWRAESNQASAEDSMFLKAHRAKHRAYLQRLRVWCRLRHCSQCGLVVDPVTLQTASLFEIHELANSQIDAI